MSIGESILVLVLGGSLAAQPPPPGPEAVRRKLAEMRPTGIVTGKMLALARTYFERSEHQARTNPFAASRNLAAADALVHAAEHQRHLVDQSGPPPPDRAELARHLEHIYFRLQQADYFTKQSSDPDATTLAGFARQYYQDAIRAYDRPDPAVADECAKSVDDLMRALENLAQATVPVPPRPRHK